MQDLKSEWLVINKKIQIWREAPYSFAKPTEPTKYSLCAFILQPHPQEKAMFVFIVWKGKTSLMRNPAAGLVGLFIFKQKLITAVHHQGVLKNPSCSATFPARTLGWVLFCCILCHKLQHPIRPPQPFYLFQWLSEALSLLSAHTTSSSLRNIIFHFWHRYTFICTQLKLLSSNLRSSCLLSFVWLLFTAETRSTLCQPVHFYFPKGSFTFSSLLTDCFFSLFSDGLFPIFLQNPTGSCPLCSDLTVKTYWI